MYLKDRCCGVLWLYTSMDAGGRLPSDSRQPIMPHWVPDTTGAWHCVILRLIRTDTQQSVAYVYSKTKQPDLDRPGHVSPFSVCLLNSSLYNPPTLTPAQPAHTWLPTRSPSQKPRFPLGSSAPTQPPSPATRSLPFMPSSTGRCRIAPLQTSRFELLRPVSIAVTKHPAMLADLQIVVAQPCHLVI